MLAPSQISVTLIILEHRFFCRFERGCHPADMTPYDYGWTPEIFIDDEGEVTVTKHYAKGRFVHDLAYIMPDNKTVDMTNLF